MARSVDVFQPHLKSVLKKAAAHGGTAFVEVLQNCNIFNDGAWEKLTDKELRDDSTIAIEHGKPLVFGKGRDKGIRMNGLALEVVTLGDGISEDDLIVHDERQSESRLRVPALAHGRDAGIPDPDRRAARRGRAGVRGADRRPGPIAVTDKKGTGDLGRLLRAGDTWEVR